MYLFFSCTKQNNSYYPLGKGLSWTYQVSRSAKFGNFPTSKLTITMIGERDIKGKKVKIRKYDYKEKSSFNFVTVENNGVYVYAKQLPGNIEPEILNPPSCVIKFPLKAGIEWEEKSNTSLLDKEIPILIKYVLESIEETVTVPAGTYNSCIKIKGIGKTTAKIMFWNVSIDKEIYNWYAPNVGWVKGILSESSTNDLAGKGMISYQLEVYGR